MFKNIEILFPFEHDKMEQIKSLIPSKNVRVNTLSGGLQSFVATWLDFKKHPNDFHLLYFTDTQYEHKTLYDFLEDSLNIISSDFPQTNFVFIHIKSDFNLWELFYLEQFQGNGRNAICSRIMKQKPGKALEAKLNLKNCPITFGFGKFEDERLKYIKKNRPTASAPLIEHEQLWDKQELIQFTLSKGLNVPYLYKLGLAHNNCGGFCVKAGQGHYKKLLEANRELYLKHESKQEELIKHLPMEQQRSVGFIIVQRKNKRHYLTLRQFRKWIEAGKPVDIFDMGTCGCFSSNLRAE